MLQLKDLIHVNTDFSNAINLYLDLNKESKINMYVPTQSSVSVLYTYLESVKSNKQKATMLIGPYGKGKSHLLLVLLSILSMDKKQKKNQAFLRNLAQRISDDDSQGTAGSAVAQMICEMMEHQDRYLPVLVSPTQENLSTSFIYGLSEALKRDNLTELIPESHYSHALDRIACWKTEYPTTYQTFCGLLKKEHISVEDLRRGLKENREESLHLFQKIYPELTAGEEFNPLLQTDAMKLYENVIHQLQERYGYRGIYLVFDEFSKYIESQDKKNSGNEMRLLQDFCELSNSSKNGGLFLTFVAHKDLKEYGKHLSSQLINSFTGIEGRIKEVYFVTSSKNNYELIRSAIHKDENKLWKNAKVKKYLKQEICQQYQKLSAFCYDFSEEEFEQLIIKGCYPLNPITAYLLLHVSELVAQNERTVFTFLAKEEENTMLDSLRRMKPDMPWMVYADCIYDYFSGTFKKDVSNEYIHNEWLNAEYALSLAENDSQRKIIKVLAIIRIANRMEELPASRQILALATGIERIDQELERMLELQILDLHHTHETYSFRTRATKELNREISNRQIRRSGKIDLNQVMSLVYSTPYILPRKYNRHAKMTRYFTCEFMETGQFLAIPKLEHLLEEIPGDGKVVYLYDMEEADHTEQLMEKLSDMPAQLVVAYARQSLPIQEQLEEYRVILDLKAEEDFWKQGEHMLLKRELLLMEEELEQEIYQKLEHAFDEKNGLCIFHIGNEGIDSEGEISAGDSMAALPVAARHAKGEEASGSKEDLISDVFFSNEPVMEQGKRINEVVEQLCDYIFEKTVTVNNELINKSTIRTAPIRRVRKNLIESILEEKDMSPYFEGTSADSTIFRALFVGTGLWDFGKKAVHSIGLADASERIAMHDEKIANAEKTGNVEKIGNAENVENTGNIENAKKTEEANSIENSNSEIHSQKQKNIEHMLQIYQDFFEQAQEKEEKCSMKELVQKLTSAPVGMRKGLIPIYFAYMLKESKKDVVIYFGDKEKPCSADMILNMCECPEDYSIFISRENEEKKSYIRALQKLFPVQGQAGILENETAALLAGMKNWMNGLPMVTKNIKSADRLSDRDYVKILGKWKKKLLDPDCNPYEMIYVTMPALFQEKDEGVNLSKTDGDEKGRQESETSLENAESGKAESSKAELSKAELSKAESSKVESNEAETDKIEPNETSGSNELYCNKYEKIANRISQMKKELDSYYLNLKNSVKAELTSIFCDVYDQKSENGLFILRTWHDAQSDQARNSLSSPKLADFMRSAAGIDVFDEDVYLRQLARSITGTTIDFWKEGQEQEFLKEVAKRKEEAEQLSQNKSKGQKCIQYTNKMGQQVSLYYNPVEEGYEETFKNVIRGELEDFSDIPVNDKLALLMEIIEEMTS